MSIEADFVIVGAGAAGCVLADRLSEDGRHRVVLLEAGGTDRKVLVWIPSGVYYLRKDKSVDWGLKTTPEPGLNGRQIDYPRGKLVGGSGSLNGMWQSRGLPSDYDAWAREAGPGWGYADLLPYFKKSESYRPRQGEAPNRGRDGAMTIDVSEVHPSTRRILSSAAAMGVSVLEDYNDAPGEGLAVVQQARRGRFRESAATAYLRAALRRPNLQLITRAQATGLIVEGGVVRGVRFRRGGGAVEEVRARAEVIVSAGTINSPHLLQLSGIGPADKLKAAGVAPILDLKGVGQNLQDHMNGRVVGRLRSGSSVNTSIRGLRLLPHLLEYVFRGTGLLTYSPANGTGFLRTDPTLTIPDIQLVISPGSYAPDGSGLDTFPAITCGNWLMRPESRGSLILRSPDPMVMPDFSFGYLTAETDQRKMVAGLRLCRKLLHTAFGSDIEEVRPGPDIDDDEGLLAYQRRTGNTTFHGAGSCRMGSDDQSVVDPQLRVRGVGGLRVVDASVMPTLTSSNTHAPTVAIAEKAAELILGRAAG